MTDVTRWDDHGYAAGLVPKPNGEFVKYADHLAALERVRVEAYEEGRESTIQPDPGIDESTAYAVSAAYQDGLARGFQEGRVEALREARDAVDRVLTLDFGELPGGAPTVTDRRPRHVKRDALAADYDRDVAEAETRGWNAAVEAARAAALGPLMHDDSCCSSGCTEQHWTEWDSRQRLLAALGQPVADLGSRPESRCDESCNCIAAPFAAAIAALRKPSTTERNEHE